jgi:PAS domain S-box-containing protein
MIGSQTSEARFGLLVQNISDIITVLASDGTIKYESPSTLRILGFTPRELIGHNAFEFIHPDDIPAVQEAFGRAIANPGLTVSPEFRFRHANGSWIYLEAIGNNLLSDPEVNGLVVTSRDVTARRTLEQQLRQAQKMEAIGQLAGGIAHDFNNMLMIMRGSCEMILARLEDDNPARHHAETLLATADRAASLTQRLLTFSRDRVYTPRVVDLNALARESANMYRPLLGSQVELAIAACEESARVKADPALLEQIIMNLAVNARDAMPDGGTLVVATALSTVSEQRGSSRQTVPPGRYAVLSISDSGIGMDAQVQERMFDPFFTTKEKGTGLGLSIVYSIVQQSGGHVSVSSEVGCGTTFEIYLPICQDAPEKDPAAIRESPVHGSGTILLAEDEDAIRQLMEEFLKRAGYTVLAAPDGQQALQLAEDCGYEIDVLVTDIIMPRMTGMELARRLSGRRPETKVVYMTGHAEDFDMRYAVMAQGNAILQKPFELGALAHALKDVLAPREQPC